jgi:DNA repair exonuclease SbcCD ATPase subunit
MPETKSYSIADAAALTGLHKNTIRAKVKSGMLLAEVRVGKFGEEYRITHQALLDAGLLSGEYVSPAEMPEPENVVDEPFAPAQANLADLFRRHEQAVYRLGWLEAELARTRALAENAESLKEQQMAREMEVRDLKRDLENALSRAREVEELRRTLSEMEQETLRLRQEIEARRAAEAAAAARRWWAFWAR